MTASVERIQQEIALLDQSLGTLAEAFQTAYASYLAALGQAVRKQHVLAAYQVCTQGYPQQFLGLSVSQRQALQQALQDLAKQAQATLLEQLHLFQQQERSQQLESPMSLQSDVSTEAQEAQVTELEETSIRIGDETFLQSSAEPSLPMEISLTPARIVQWQARIEQSIGRELAAISHQTNRLLQQSNILPSQLPDALLQHASKTELADGIPRSPNLLNVLVEAVNNAETTNEEEEGKAPELLQVLAIHLRLVEIEFADTPTMTARSKIRELTARLKKLGQDYRKKQREYAIAAAQEAWRASWFEE
ncbi:MAG: hypothetical protein DCF22_19360 [Leptolyngbya sp.]|nr:MAG: hypothetical protein DCF22_19360 [Leptolyngbya sp.]